MKVMCLNIKCVSEGVTTYFSTQSIVATLRGQMWPESVF